MKKSPFLLGILFILALNFSPASAEPQGQVVVAQGVDPSTLDPHNHQETPAFNVLLNMFDTLLRRTPDLKIEPLLAESYRLIDDKIWEFKLRRGIKFHNGEDFNAEAVKFSLERIANPENKMKQLSSLKFLDHVEIIDEYTVHIVTKEPFAPLPAFLCLYGSIVPPKYVKEKGDTYIATHPVGTGAFRFVKWTKDDQLVMEANPSYFRGAPSVKTVIFRPIPEATTRVAALLTGDVDIITNVPPNLVPQIEGSGQAFISTAPSVRVIFVGIDTLHGGPVADKRVRQALNYAVDVNSLIKNVLEGHGFRVATPLTKDHFGYNPDIQPYPFDPDKAKKLLAEAGYPNGFDLILNSPDGRYLNDKQIAEAIAGQWQKVGIRTQVKTHEWGNYVNMMYTHKPGPVYLLGWGNSTYDADNTYFPLFHTGELLSNYSNPEFDKLIEEARITMDENKRRELYHKAAELIVEDAAWVFLYEQEDIYGVNNRLNWKARPDEGLVMFDVTIKK
ncbi:MAG TPA: ABC transporter substrate-binding protein [Candidatus Limnocylindrales bacterium]|nr:ABC transporter substrate-binding protein [Candidatus Limnocylindrales bacterium]